MDTNDREVNKQGFYVFTFLVVVALVFGFVLPDYEGKDRIFGYLAVCMLLMFFHGFIPYMRDLLSKKK